MTIHNDTMGSSIDESYRCLDTAVLYQDRFIPVKKGLTKRV
jgi:hypothetical protein